jgi:predicted nucleic-acid-binding Zn-ribbon protein
MRFPWQPAEYARTCAECGYTWRVPRSAARRRFRSISALNIAWGGTMIDRAELRNEIQSIEAQNQPVETFRHCPKCGADHFTQRPLRHTEPNL